MGKKTINTQASQVPQNGWNIISQPITIICGILALAVPAAYVIGQSYAKYEANIVLTEYQEKLVNLQNNYEKEIHDLHNQVYELQNEIVTLKQDKQYGTQK